MVASRPGFQKLQQEARGERAWGRHGERKAGFLHMEHIGEGQAGPDYASLCKPRHAFQGEGRQGLKFPPVPCSPHTPSLPLLEKAISLHIQSSH